MSSANVIEYRFGAAPAAQGPAFGEPGVILVADDDPSNRQALRSRLELLGYRVVEATDGHEAVARFDECRPDLVFMDVMMPRMDGTQAAWRIKSRCGDEFVPVIFLTAASEVDALSDCMRAGGDDFLVEPYGAKVLEAKLRATSRIRDLQRRLRGHLARERRDQEIAQDVFDGVVSSDNLATDAIRTLSRPATTFSGDVVLSDRAPSGDLHLLVGDFTGHGLAAALGALPASETFRAMTRKGFSIGQIRNAIDHKLAGLLPTGMFMAAHVVAIDPSGRHVTISNSAMPDALVVGGASGAIRHRIASSGVALGIAPGADALDVEHLDVEPGDRIVLASDGLTDAIGRGGERFGQERYEASMRDDSLGVDPFDRIVAGLECFRGDAELEDDVTLVEILVVPELFHGERGSAATAPVPSPERDRGSDGWEIAMSLSGPRLRDVDPVPLLMSQIQEFGAAEARRAPLFTVLTELYVNALDHGVLGLDSSLKAGSDGFRVYMRERERRLDALEDGMVRLSVRATEARDGLLRIRVEDTGLGFDPAEVASNRGAAPAFHGRGLVLVGDLCESVVFEPPGNCVEVLFDGAG